MMQSQRTEPPKPAETTAPARPAATLVVCRDSLDGIEVLLLRRAERGDHASSAWVFPGGVLDARDREWHRCCSGLDDAQASRQLGMASGGLDYHVAAIRECFEESGLLFAHDARGALVSTHGKAGAEIGHWRGPLHRGERSLAEFCERFGLSLAADRLVYYSRWVTPSVRAKRWDTRFFFVEAPPGQESAHDEVELVEQAWLRPADALARSESLRLLTPTRTTLETIARFSKVADLLAYARTPRTTARQVPRVADGSRGMQPVTPQEHAWAEVGRLDPQGHGTASYEIVPGTPVRLSERVTRLTAGNPSVMTGPGTNSYFVAGKAGDGCAVIDPGPLNPAHVERLLALAPAPIRWILVTHTHGDHSPAAALLKARTGAEVLGQPAPRTEHQDHDFAPDRILGDGDRLAVSSDTTLRVVHTPGHASNHLCFLLEEERALFTGDHLMQGSTVVINPPDGDMAAYLASLRRLLTLDLEWLVPGHGFIMEQPAAAIEGIIAHRLKREDKVMQAVRDLGPADANALLARVYDDVPAHLHRWALRSLAAHLEKLRDESRIREADGRWQAN